MKIKTCIVCAADDDVKYHMMITGYREYLYISICDECLAELKKENVAHVG